MRARPGVSLFLAIVAASSPSDGQTLRATTKISAGAQNDPLFRSMLNDLPRARTLQLNNLQKPYFISFGTHGSEQAVLAASLGRFTPSNLIRVRQPHIEIRVGTYAF